MEEWCRGLPAEHATYCGSFTNERQRKAHAFIRADIKVPTVYALLGHNKVRMRVQRISRLLRTHTVFFTMRIPLSLSLFPSPLLFLSLYLSISLSLSRSLAFSCLLPLLSPILLLSRSIHLIRKVSCVYNISFSSVYYVLA